MAKIVKVLLTGEQVEEITRQLKYQIKENEDLISDLTNQQEINAWREQNRFFESIINDLKNAESEEWIEESLTSSVLALKLP